MGVEWDWSVREVLDGVGSEGEIWDWVEMGGEGWCGRVVWEVGVIGDGEETERGSKCEWVERGDWCGRGELDGRGRGDSWVA